MNTSKFGKHQPSLIVLTLMILGTKSIGRYELSKYLNQSLAKTRSILNLLVTNDLAQTAGQSSGKKGTTLTVRGHKLYKNLTANFQLYISPAIRHLINDLIIDKNVFTLLFFNSETTKVTGLFERDLAVRNGANGAITLIKRNGNWQFPDGFNFPTNFSEFFEVSEIFNCCIIVFSEQIGDACVGAITVVEYYLYEEIMKILLDFIKKN